MNKVWYDLKEMIEREVSKVVMKNELLPQDIEMLDKVTDIAKDICCMEKDEAEKYSFDRSGKRFSMEYDNSYPSMGNMHNLPHMSYGDRGNNRDGYQHMQNYGGSSYAGQQSNHSIEDRIVHEMELMMDNTGSDYEKQKLQEYINKMRSGM